MIDAHCHLHFEAFDDDRDEALARAVMAGVQGLVVADYDHRLRGALQRLGERPGVAVCAGVHPWAVDAMGADVLTRELALLEDVLDEEGWAAVGEFGLDFVRATDKEARALQLRACSEQLRMARERKLPVVLHAVRCHSTLHDLLRREGASPAGGIMHGYSGSARQVPLFLMHGLDISVGGRLARNPEKLRAVVQQVPLERMHLETDSPDGPTPGQSAHERSEPADLFEVARAVAAALHQPPERLVARCSENTRRLFRLDGTLSADA
ncbi:TatD family deoxyribonuclease [Bradymonadaceae bacterium TMQ3]|nr:TatD family deoxyribonuclease [Bradymonadaceae bacterium TMQ3]TXC78216.1 TatD family deoxyribonuclease [Bradymonadales bacterium TMQ1]